MSEVQCIKDPDGFQIRENTETLIAKKEFKLPEIIRETSPYAKTEMYASCKKQDEEWK